jgi:hypothetical protein
MGVGTQSCAVFANSYKSDPSMWELIYFSWAQGYMSRINTTAALHNIDNKNFRAANLNAMSINSQQSFLRSYCDRNPLRSYSEAATELLITI